MHGFRLPDLAVRATAECYKFGRATNDLGHKPPQVAMTDLTLGYGLDFAEKYRNIPEVQVLSD